VHKTTFILALAGYNAALTESVGVAIEDVKSSVDAMRAKEQRDRILEWIKGRDSSINHNAARKKKEAGTCEWLLRSQQFRSFTEQENQLMWLHGIPGAGKTVLSSSVIDHLSASKSQKIIYYYFDFNDHASQTCCSCLRSLVWQFCSQSDQTPEAVAGFYEECKGAAPSSEQLIQVLITILGNEAGTYIIIDALDECMDREEAEERTAMLNALNEIKTCATSPVNVFVASRPEADITSEMADICDIDMDVQAALVDEDIRCHVRACLAKDARLKTWPAPVKKEIEDKLTGDANGMSVSRKALCPSVWKLLTFLGSAGLCASWPSCASVASCPTSGKN
jgi:hypothetical protein